MSEYVRGTARSTASINDELEKIQNSLADKLDRTPDVGQANEMLDDIDMNSNRIYNVPDPVSSQDAVNKEYVDGVLVDLGAQSVTPIEVDRSTGDGVTAGYTVPNSLSSPARSYLVHLDGVRQKPVTDYNVVGTTLTFVTPPANGVAIDITYYEPQVANNLDSVIVFDNVSDAKADLTLVAGDTVDTLGYYVANDGGGARYVVVAGGTGTDDGGSYHDLDNGLQLRLLAVTPSTKQFGATGTESVSDTTALHSIATAYDEFTISSGTYPPLNFSYTDKTVHFEDNVIFKLADDTSDSLETTPFSCFEISGSGNTFYGKLTVDGNSTNNSSASTDLSFRKGSFAVQGDNNTWYGDVIVSNAYYVGYSVGADDSLVCSNWIHKGSAVNESSVNYAFAMWSCDGFIIDNIISNDLVQTLDHRIRTGTQTSSTKECKNGIIGSILGKNMVGVFEKNTVNMQIGSIVMAGWKVEEVDTFSVATAISEGVTIDAFGFGVISSSNLNLGKISVIDYAGLQTRAVQVFGITDSHIDSIIVEGADASSADFRLGTADNLHIGSVICTNPVGVSIGFQFDYDVAFAPQRGIVIDSIISEGHTGLDIEIQNYEATDIQLGRVNPSATSNIDYLSHKDVYLEGSHTATLTPQTSGSVSLNQSSMAYTQVGRTVQLQGRVRVSSTSSPIGTLHLNLPRQVVDLTSESDWSSVIIYAQGLTTLPDGAYTGYTLQGTDEVYVDIDSSELQTNSLLVFNINYITDEF